MSVKVDDAEFFADARVVITGGAGFIGQTVARALAPWAGELLLVDSLHPDVHGDDPEDPQIAGAAFLRGDVTNPLTWDQVLADIEPTVVVHLAAETGTGQSLSQATRHGSVNVVGTTAMLDALYRRPKRPGHLLLTSSRAVYGEGAWEAAGAIFYAEPRTHAALAEARWDPLGPDGQRATSVPSVAGLIEPRPTNVYAATKLAQEYVMRAWATATATPLSILRLQNVYGPGQSLINSYTGVLALFARLAVSGKPIDLYEDGQAVRDFVYVDDVAQAIVNALSRPPARPRAVDIGSGASVTLGQVARLMADWEGAPSPEVSGSYREGDVRAASCRIAAAGKEIAYRPEFDLQRGLAELLDWVRAELGQGEAR